MIVKLHMSCSLYKLGQTGCVKVRYGYLLAEVNILLTLSTHPLPWRINGAGEVLVTM